MDLSVREAARLLAVSEDTVYRWIREASLPAHHIRHQYWLNRVELQEWAATRDHRLSPDLFTSNGTERPLGLVEALERGGIHRGVTGARREDVLEAITLLPNLPDIDRKLLYQLLLAREALASTTIGHGIALPHPRDPVVLRVREPHVLLCFLAAPVDFGALDGEPVRTLFLLLSPSVRAHLQVLAMLAYALHDEDLRRMLHSTEQADVILAHIRAIEQRNARP